MAPLALFQVETRPLWLNLAIFAVASAIVWLAGTKLSHYADVISERTGLGQAFVGLLLLATATSLPEIATTVTATSIGSVPLVVGNLLGGVSMQTAVLALVDGVAVSGGALTRRTPKPALLLHGLLLVLLLTIVLTSIALGGRPAIYHVGAGTVALFGVYLTGVYLAQRYERNPRWQAVDPGRPADTSDADNTHSRRADEDSGPRDRLRQRYRGTSLGRIVFFFCAGASAILAAGWTITQVGDALAKQTGIGGTLVGFVLVAVATSLPEVSTTFSAARLGAFSMVFANIFGGNAFDAALLFVADVLYRDGPVLAAVESWAVLAAALGIAMTCVYLWGLVERGDRTIFRMGIDSALVIVLYASGVAALYFIR